MITIVQAVTTIALFGITQYLLVLLASLVASVATWVCVIKGAGTTTTVVTTIVVGAAAAGAIGVFTPFVTCIISGYVALACKILSAKMVRASVKEV